MRFSELNPLLGGSMRFTVEKPIWQLSFECPLCRQRTSIDVTNLDPFDHVWNLSPDPLRLFDSIVTDQDILAQHRNIWDAVTIKPSMQNLPHSRKNPCPAHFSVDHGNVVLS